MKHKGISRETILTDEFLAKFRPGPNPTLRWRCRICGTLFGSDLDALRHLSVPCAPRRGSPSRVPRVK